MQDCLFCKITHREIQAEFVYEDEDFVAFHDIKPRAPVHILIVPKKHIPTMNDITAEDSSLLGRLMLTAKAVAEKTGVASSGYRLIINCGKDGGQVIDHLHLHVLGGTTIGPKGKEL